MCCLAASAASPTCSRAAGRADQAQRHRDRAQPGRRPRSSSPVAVPTSAIRSWRQGRRSPSMGAGQLGRLLQARPRPRGGEKISALKFEHKFPGAPKVTSAADLKDALLDAAFKEQRQSDHKVNYAADIKPWLGDQVALAVYADAQRARRRRSASCRSTTPRKPRPAWPNWSQTRPTATTVGLRDRGRLRRRRRQPGERRRCRCECPQRRTSTAHAPTPTTSRR